MADNVTFQSATPATPASGVTVATDDVSGAQFQRIKLDIGPDGTSTPVVAGGAGLPLGTLPGGTLAMAGTAQALGTVQPLAGSVHLASALPGTAQALGTVQPLAGSVHLASGLPGTVQALGSVQTVGTGQILGTVRIVEPAAVAQSGAWAVTLSGTGQVLGTVQPHGTGQILGTVRALIDAGTIQALGSVQPVGTGQIAGTVQVLAGSVHPAAPLPGTSQISGTVRAVTGAALGETFFSTIVTASQSQATLIAAPAAGTFIRIWDILISGSAAGTARLEYGPGTTIGHLHVAANGGWGFNSARGLRSQGTAQLVAFSCAVGTWGITINYSLET